MKKLFVIAVALAAVLAACGAKTYTGTQLSSIVPGQNDSPSGLQYIAQGSGAQKVTEVASDPAEQSKLESFGFLSAYSSFYANTDALSVLETQGGAASPSAKVVAMIGIVFKTADGAHKAIQLEHQSDLKNGSNVKTVATDKIGDETIAESGQQQDFPFPGYLLYFREANAVFAVLVAGGPTSNATITEASGYAKTMASRAQKV
jgi:hypothetical protein